MSDNTREEIFSKVKAIVVESLGVDESKVDENSNFTSDLGADSLDTIELVMKLEEDFNIEISDADAQKIATIKDAVDFIVKGMQE